MNSETPRASRTKDKPEQRTKTDKATEAKQPTQRQRLSKLLGLEAKAPAPYDPTKASASLDVQLFVSCTEEVTKERPDTSDRTALLGEVWTRYNARHWADRISKPEFQAATTQHLFGDRLVPGPELNRLEHNLEQASARIAAGDMTDVESMLFSQAAALNTMFTVLTRRAESQDQLKHFQVNLSLAFKAQTQCRSTLEALAYVKNPPAVSFIKQQNNAGTQQVNNGAPPPDARARSEIEVDSNKLTSGEGHGALEHSTPTVAVPALQPAAAVESLVRAEDARG